MNVKSIYKSLNLDVQCPGRLGNRNLSKIFLSFGLVSDTRIIGFTSLGGRDEMKLTHIRLSAYRLNKCWLLL